MSSPIASPLPAPSSSPSSQSPAAIVVAPGDGIGPEIMDVTLDVLDAAGARLDIRRIDVGEALYLRGVTSGITGEGLSAVAETGVLLKGPITTPEGGGMKSVNVTLRKALGLYANVRPCRAFAPFVRTRHPAMDLVIIRENEEDLYAGIEHRLSREVYQCLKLISRPGCERIVRYAFEYAKAHGRRKVSCFTKDNIMKLTDGLFRRVFEEIGASYPDITREHRIVDIGAARLATRPELFDVVVTLNLYGDILSDVAAEMAGSVGLSGSANIGARCAMFEAIHGSAPDIAGKDVANPSGLLESACLMLVHLGQTEVAARIRNAWLATIEEGVRTADLADASRPGEVVGTRRFGKEVIRRLGREPRELAPVRYAEARRIPAARAADVLARSAPRERKEVMGADVFLDWSGGGPAALAAELQRLESVRLRLTLITNRGVKVWPEGRAETTCTDSWRCRFHSRDGRPVPPQECVALLGRVVAAGLDLAKMQTLYTFDGEPGFTLGQGQ